MERKNWKYKKRRHIIQAEVEGAIKQLKFQAFTSSWRDANSEYGQICTELNRKNTPENRLRVRAIIKQGITKEWTKRSLNKGCSKENITRSHILRDQYEKDQQSCSFDEVERELSHEELNRLKDDLVESAATDSENSQKKSYPLERDHCTEENQPVLESDDTISYELDEKDDGDGESDQYEKDQQSCSFDDVERHLPHEELNRLKDDLADSEKISYPIERDHCTEENQPVLESDDTISCEFNKKDNDAESDQYEKDQQSCSFDDVERHLPHEELNRLGDSEKISYPIERDQSDDENLYCPFAEPDRKLAEEPLDLNIDDRMERKLTNSEKKSDLIQREESIEDDQSEFAIDDTILKEKSAKQVRVESGKAKKLNKRNVKENNQDQHVVTLVDEELSYIEEEVVSDVHEEPEEISDDHFTKELLTAVYGSSLTERYFKKKVPTTSSFRMKASQWQQLRKTQKGRYFARGTWEDIISDGVKKINPYCVYMYKNHKVTVANKRNRKTNATLFRGEGECKFQDCQNKCKFSMDDSYLVQIKISPTVKHKMSDKHARPIRGYSRQQTREVFKHGKKPYKHFLDKFQETSKDVKIAGNFSNFGNTTRTFQQIATESRYQNRLDNNEFESLCLQREKMEKEHPGVKIHGFIQHIAIWPPYIMYYTENGIRIWHDMAKFGIVYWDATGRILSHRDDNLKYFYYELACTNPIQGEPVIPVSCMISSLHSTSLLRFWLSEFRRSEKKIFGHGNAVTPYQINSDRSMAFIQAALSEFNNADLNSFRSRAYRIINGTATEGDFKGIYPHACLSHVMGSFRKTALECYKSNFEFGMYCFSALLNCSTLHEIKGMLFSFYYVLSSKVLDDTTIKCLDKLQGKISTLGLKTADLDETCTDSLYCKEDHIDELFTEQQNPDYLTEEDFHTRSTTNEFSTFSTAILNSVRDEIDKQFFIEVPGNKRYSPVLLDKLHKLYIPTLPLWSNLLIGDLTRHGTSDIYSKSKQVQPISRGNTKIEKRFQILKDIALQGQTTRRLDEISVQLKDHIIAVQEFAVLNSVKPRKTTVTRKGRSTKLIEEMWDKRNKTATESALVGKYQTAPTKEKTDSLLANSKVTPKKQQNVKQKHTENTSKDGHTNDASCQLAILDKKTEMFKDDARYANTLIDLNSNKYLREVYSTMATESEDLYYLQHVRDLRTGLENLSNTCWFNAVVQLLFDSSFMRKVNEQFITNISFDENLRSVLKVFHQMGLGEEVTKNQIQRALNELYTIYGLEPDRQNDVHEFLANAIDHFMEMSGEDIYIKILEAYVCKKCGTKTGKDEQIYSNIQVQIFDDVLPYERIMDLLDRYFEDEEIETTCSCCNGKKRWRHIRMVNRPSDLTIQLVRHEFKNDRPYKNRKPVCVDRIINIGKFMATKTDTLYRLTGVVIHHGIGPRNGHYTYVKQDGGVPVQIDDDIFRIFDGNQIITDGYLLQYELIPNDEDICHRYLPDIFLSILQCKGWSELSDFIQFSPGLSISKKKLFDHIQQIEISTNSVTHSYVTYKLLQEAIGPQQSFIGDTLIEDIAKTILSYISSGYPSLINNTFGISAIKSLNCQSCATREIYHHHDIIITMDDLKPLNSNAKTQELKLCQKCNEYAVVEKKCVVNIGNTVILKNCSDIMFSGKFEELMLSYQPKALLTLNDTVIFKTNAENKQTILLLEPYHEVIQIEYDQLIATVDWKDPCVLLMDKKRPDTVSQLHIEVSPTMNKDGRKELDIVLSDEDLRLTKKFKAPLSVGTLKLRREDVYRFLYDEFSDANIDAFLQTIQSDDTICMPAAWFQNVLNSPTPANPDTSRKWFEKNWIFIPINIEHTHWMLIVVIPEERKLLYLDPLGCKPKSDILDKMSRHLNIQCLMENFDGLTEKWTVENVMLTGFFPLQKDSSSCGAMICLYATLIKHKYIITNPNVMESHIREYIFSEVINMYKNQKENDLQFGLHNVIFTRDLDTIVHSVVTGCSNNTELHNSFLKAPTSMKRQNLVGFADDFLHPDEFYSIQTYLTDTYFKSIRIPLQLNQEQSIFDDAIELNKKLKLNFSYKAIYVEYVLVKEVLTELLGRIHKMPYKQMKQLCLQTEYSSSEMIKETIKGFREARKQMKMSYL